ncbi:unnamed protein product [Amoebophrya sp. A120]|nr:unnamed protein product [Amoebophrya sp. A120]|eukprot:GSA120T00000735001.1
MFAPYASYDCYSYFFYVLWTAKSNPAVSNKMLVDLQIFQNNLTRSLMTLLAVYLTVSTTSWLFWRIRLAIRDFDYSDKELALMFDESWAPHEANLEDLILTQYAAPEDNGGSNASGSLNGTTTCVVEEDEEDSCDEEDVVQRDLYGDNNDKPAGIASKKKIESSSFVLLQRSNTANTVNFHDLMYNSMLSYTSENEAGQQAGNQDLCGASGKEIIQNLVDEQRRTSLQMNNHTMQQIKCDHLPARGVSNEEELYAGDNHASRDHNITDEGDDRRAASGQHQPQELHPHLLPVENNNTPSTVGTGSGSSPVDKDMNNFDTTSAKGSVGGLGSSTSRSTPPRDRRLENENARDPLAAPDQAQDVGEERHDKDVSSPSTFPSRTIPPLAGATGSTAGVPAAAATGASSSSLQHRNSPSPPAHIIPQENYNASSVPSSSPRSVKINPDADLSAYSYSAGLPQLSSSPLLQIPLPPGRSSSSTVPRANSSQAGAAFNSNAAEITGATATYTTTNDSHYSYNSRRSLNSFTLQSSGTRSSCTTGGLIPGCVTTESTRIETGTKMRMNSAGNNNSRNDDFITAEQQNQQHIMNTTFSRSPRSIIPTTPPGAAAGPGRSNTTTSSTHNHAAGGASTGRESTSNRKNKDRKNKLSMSGTTSTGKKKRNETAFLEHIEEANRRNLALREATRLESARSLASSSGQQHGVVQPNRGNRNFYGGEAGAAQQGRGQRGRTSSHSNPDPAALALLASTDHVDL